MHAITSRVNVYSERFYISSLIVDSACLVSVSSLNESTAHKKMCILLMTTITQGEMMETKITKNKKKKQKKSKRKKKEKKKPKSRYY